MNQHAEMEAIPVHIVSTEVATEEREPEHFVFFTYVLTPYSSVEPGGQSAGGWYEGILKQDPRRKSAAIYSPDGAFIACHSEAQASDSSNLEAGTPFPQGAYFPQGSSFAVDGTGPIWAVNPGNSTIRITVVTNRRGVN